MFRIGLFDCLDDGNNFGYRLECDPDLNKYDSDDLKELSQSGLGTAGREVVLQIDFLVVLAIIVIVLTTISVIVARSKGLLGGRG